MCYRRVLVKKGDTVSVVDRAGKEARGPISGLSSSSLAIAAKATVRPILKTDRTGVLVSLAF